VAPAVAKKTKPVRDGNVKAPAVSLRPGEFPGQPPEAKGKALFCACCATEVWTLKAACKKHTQGKGHEAELAEYSKRVGGSEIKGAVPKSKAIHSPSTDHRRRAISRAGSCYFLVDSFFFLVPGGMVISRFPGTRNSGRPCSCGTPELFIIPGPVHAQSYSRTFGSSGQGCA
jgi:hypothetical protein